MAVKYSSMVSPSACTLNDFSASSVPFSSGRVFLRFNGGKEEVLLCPTSLEELLAQASLGRWFPAFKGTCWEPEAPVSWWFLSGLLGTFNRFPRKPVGAGSCTVPAQERRRKPRFWARCAREVLLESEECFELGCSGLSSTFSCFSHYLQVRGQLIPLPKSSPISHALLSRINCFSVTLLSSPLELLSYHAQILAWNCSTLSPMSQFQFVGLGLRQQNQFPGAALGVGLPCNF